MKALIIQDRRLRKRVEKLTLEINKRQEQTPSSIWQTGEINELDVQFVLFIDGTFREEAGNYVPFVVWFNFLVGFVYLIAGGGLWRQKHWAVWVSIFISVTTLVVFAIFGIHILKGGVYEIRTIAAMSIRTIVWASIAIFAYRKIICQWFVK
jgi:hypothetical protein